MKTNEAFNLRCAGVYRREVGASVARIWENVFDWEHLPALHATDFHAVHLLDRGQWGWRIQLVNQPGDPTKAQVLELKVDKPAGRYVVATLEGPGAGSEIRVGLSKRAARATNVTVEFYVPEDRPDRLRLIGERYLEVYQRLWDEDEAMMRERERACRARRRQSSSPAPPKKLGPLERLRLPLTVAFGGRRVRIAEIDGEVLTYVATCPHWLGPLDQAPIIDGCVRCPWHGYRFDIRTGQNADGHGLSLPAPPTLQVRDGIAWLVDAELS